MKYISLLSFLLFTISLQAKSPADFRQDTLVRNDSLSVGLNNSGSIYFLYYAHDMTGLLSPFTGGTMTRVTDMYESYFPHGTYTVDSVRYLNRTDQTLVYFHPTSGLVAHDWTARPLPVKYQKITTVNDGGGRVITQYDQLRPQLLALADSLKAFRTYTAILNQSGTSAPTATVFENSLGGTVTWARSATGIYTATLTGAFTSGKTWIVVGSVTNERLNYDKQAARTDANTVTLYTTNSSASAVDAILSDTPIEIRVYK